MTEAGLEPESYTHRKLMAHSVKGKMAYWLSWPEAGHRPLPSVLLPPHSALLFYFIHTPPSFNKGAEVAYSVRHVKPTKSKQAPDTNVKEKAHVVLQGPNIAAYLESDS